MPQPDTALSVPELAATLHARFAGRLDRLHTPALFGPFYACDFAVRSILGPAARAATNDDGRVCPTCEGECVVDDCAEDTCVCDDPPCAERACPTCGGIGSV